MLKGHGSGWTEHCCLALLQLTESTLHSRQQAVLQSALIMTLTKGNITLGHVDMLVYFAMLKCNRMFVVFFYASTIEKKNAFVISIICMTFIFNLAFFLILFKLCFTDFVRDILRFSYILWFVIVFMSSAINNGVYI